MQVINEQSRPDYKLCDMLVELCTQQGIYLDKTLMLQYHDEFNKKTEECKTQLRQIANNEDFNPNSHVQIKDLLFNKCKFDKNLFVDCMGDITTNTDVLTKIYEQTNNETIKLVLNYRDYSYKLRELTKLLKYGKDTDKVSNDGHELVVINPSWSHTISMRYSMKEPNIQSLPSYFNNLLVAPKGYDILSVDIGQQELIIFFFFLIKNPVIEEYFKDEEKNSKGGKVDYYMAMTQYVLSVYNIFMFIKKRIEAPNFDESILYNPQTQEDKVLSSCFLYKQTKKGVSLKKKKINVYDIPYALNYDYIYMLPKYIKFNRNNIPEGFRDTLKYIILKGQYGASSKRLMADSKFIGSVYHTVITHLPNMESYINNIKNVLKTTGKNKELICKSFFNTESKLRVDSFSRHLRQLLNRPVQTTGADLTCFMLMAFYNYRIKNNLVDSDIRLLMPRYDELLFYVNKNHKDIPNDILDLCQFKIADWVTMYSSMTLGERYIH